MLSVAVEEGAESSNERNSSSSHPSSANNTSNNSSNNSSHKSENHRINSNNNRQIHSAHSNISHSSSQCINGNKGVEVEGDGVDSSMSTQQRTDTLLPHQSNQENPFVASKDNARSNDPIIKGRFAMSLAGGTVKGDLGLGMMDTDLDGATVGRAPDTAPIKAVEDMPPFTVVVRIRPLQVQQTWSSMQPPNETQTITNTHTIRRCHSMAVHRAGHTASAPDQSPDLGIQGSPSLPQNTSQPAHPHQFRTIRAINDTSLTFDAKFARRSKYLDTTAAASTRPATAHGRTRTGRGGGAGGGGGGFSPRLDTNTRRGAGIPASASMMTYDKDGRRRRPGDEAPIPFAFDHVIHEDADNRDVFHVVEPVVHGLLKGYNATVFAYGATGAGKTHTMTGTPTQPGIMVQTLQTLFRLLQPHQAMDVEGDPALPPQSHVNLSYIEIYNETLRDLMAPSPTVLTLRDDGKGDVALTTKGGGGGGGGLTICHPTSSADVLALLEKGNARRAQGETMANATSSRSHAICIVRVTYYPDNASGGGAMGEKVEAKLTLVDLAGSERACVAQRRGVQIREGANINRSLLALGNCINALCDTKKRKKHIPYRDSKLTRLLRDSLGGNCRTVMIAAVCPALLNYEDTHNTLVYANRAKNIKAKITRNVAIDEKDQLRLTMATLRKDVGRLHATCEAMQVRQTCMEQLLLRHMSKDVLLEALSNALKNAGAPEQYAEAIKIPELSSAAAIALNNNSSSSTLSSASMGAMSSASSMSSLRPKRVMALATEGQAVAALSSRTSSRTSTGTSSSKRSFQSHDEDHFQDAQSYLPSHNANRSMSSIKNALDSAVDHQPPAKSLKTSRMSTASTKRVPSASSSRSQRSQSSTGPASPIKKVSGIIRRAMHAVFSPSTKPSDHGPGAGNKPRRHKTISRASSTANIAKSTSSTSVTSASSVKQRSAIGKGALRRGVSVKGSMVSDKRASSKATKETTASVHATEGQTGSPIASYIKKMSIGNVRTDPISPFNRRSTMGIPLPSRILNSPVALSEGGTPSGTKRRSITHPNPNRTGSANGATIGSALAATSAIAAAASSKSLPRAQSVFLPRGRGTTKTTTSPTHKSRATLEAMPEDRPKTATGYRHEDTAEATRFTRPPALPRAASMRPQRASAASSSQSRTRIWR